MVRISTNQYHQVALDALLGQQAKLSHLQEQVATGRRILNPSDDPPGAARSLELAGSIDKLDTYNRNIGFAESRLSLEETVLDQAGNHLQRVRELAVKANNATNTPEDRRKIAVEVRERFDALVQLANTSDGNGEYLFSGSKTDTRPFVTTGNQATPVNYNGDSTNRELDVGPSRRMEISHTGDTVFNNVTTGNPNNDQDSIFKIVNDFADALQNGTNFPADGDDAIDGVDGALEQVLGVRASIGGRLNGLEGERDANDAAALELKSTRSEIRDLDYASAISELSRRLTGMQAAQKSYAKIQGMSLFDYL